ncbi:MAG: methyl-accepting chemotaxis protein [Arcobacter sp.]|uniref:methyl-accepting chemotaxis protein n=1 Tax=Arcobacter sp. TaxID=1872629 RepID=UPI00258EA0F1|nr:methyl-accepting chemotaxis protein [Arcobacter sp.]MDD3009026.1 methyl-accepting chemotaxis protein [Arcobacter sp.]
MLSFFRNLKVKVKIYLLILIGIISLAVVVIPTINELNSTIDRVEKANEVNKINRRFADMRIQEKNYAIRHDETSIKNHEKLYLETVDILNLLEKRFKNPENLKSLAQIKEKLESYKINFQKFVDSEKNRSKTNVATPEEEVMINNAREVDTVVDSFRKSQDKQAQDDISTLKTTLITISIIALLVLILFGTTLVNSIIHALEAVQNGLRSFFSFLNKETNKVEKIQLDTTDEFGEMAKFINKNIELTEKTINDDNALIEEAKVVMQRVNNGWYSQYIEKSTPNKALDEFKNNVNDMIKNTKNRFLEVDEILEEYATYNYTKTLQMKPNDEKGGVFERLVVGINSLQKAVTNMLMESQTNGKYLENASITLKQNVNTLSSSANEAAASLEETAAALEEITATVVSNSRNISDMDRYSKEVTKSATQGQNLAKNTSNAMDELSNEINLINEAISVIDQIAFQTNILSLNAAVEAATAGEAGKGFAVVAQEVRNLANRSAEAAKEIKEIVESTTRKANDGKNITSNMILGYDELLENINKTIDMINEITMSSKEQEAGITQINDAVTQLDQQTQQNAAIANETQDIALKTDSIARNIIEDLKDKVFVGKI